MKDESIAVEINQSMKTLSDRLESDSAFKAEFTQNPIEAFLGLTSNDFQEHFSTDHQEMLQKVLDDSKPEANSSTLLQGSFWGGVECWSCKVALNAGVIALFGTAIAVTGGAAIAPIIAAQAGIIPVLAAMTGLSELAVGGILAGGALTFEGLIEGLCSGMGACS